jgi:hypothetical protein
VACSCASCVRSAVFSSCRARSRSCRRSRDVAAEMRFRSCRARSLPSKKTVEGPRGGPIQRAPTELRWGGGHTGPGVVATHRFTRIVSSKAGSACFCGLPPRSFLASCGCVSLSRGWGPRSVSRRRGHDPQLTGHQPGTHGHCMPHLTASRPRFLMRVLSGPETAPVCSRAASASGAEARSSRSCGGIVAHTHTHTHARARASSSARDFLNPWQQ